MSSLVERTLRVIERCMASGNLTDAELVLRAYAADAAVDRVSDDADSYRVLADTVSATIPNSDAWDGDDAEVSILVDYVRDMRDMVRHQAAEELRAVGLDLVAPGVLADRIDPFRRCDGTDCTGDAAHWRRKSDGSPVDHRGAGGCE